ncbi:MAG TPA: FAD:protein FMN transferase [Methylomirabilota bacterium]|nr:FAD:protein FMN transferase [Methylomirabilota bacterium]
MSARSRYSVRLSHALLVGLLYVLPPNQAISCTSDGRYVMGTVLEITICDRLPALSQPLINAALASAVRLDTQLSTFLPESAVSRLNAKAGHDTVLAPPELIDLLQISQRYWRLTHETFDITVGPLMKLWAQAGRTNTLPADAALRHVRNSVGGGAIQFFPGNRVALPRAGMAVDLGGIGKGYALDRLVGMLKAQGIKSALLDFGQSSMWALGAPPDAPRWRLLVQWPDGQNVGILSLRDQALSISASFAQRFLIQGQAYGHIIDPRSGAPLTRNLLACVIAPEATLAEALSKALLILGEREGIALLEQLPGVEGFLSEADGRRWTTSEWNSATLFEAAQARKGESSASTPSRAPVAH